VLDIKLEADSESWWWRYSRLVPVASVFSDTTLEL
jgi:hypothetical protein